MKEGAVTQCRLRIRNGAINLPADCLTMLDAKPVRLRVGRLTPAGGVGLRARAPAALAYEELGIPDSAAAICQDLARAPFGWISNATSGS
jgi:hypothetical protein